MQYAHNMHIKLVFDIVDLLQLFTDNIYIYIYVDNVHEIYCTYMETSPYLSFVMNTNMSSRGDKFSFLFLFLQVWREHILFHI